MDEFKNFRPDACTQAFIDCDRNINVGFYPHGMGKKFYIHCQPYDERIGRIMGKGDTMTEAIADWERVRAAAADEVHKLSTATEMREAVIGILEGKVDKDVFEAINALPTRQ